MNPLAPLPDRRLRRQVRRDVRANTVPLIRDITREINRRARAGSQNISGITNELATNLGALAPQEHAIYDTAKTSLGSLDTAIADRLAATGARDEAGMKAKLALSGVPSALVESLAGGAGAAGTGASAAGFTRGSAEVAALNSRGAGAEDYAAKLPGLAKLSGLQGVKELEAGSQRDLTNQLDRIRASTPSLIASAMRDVRNREVNKATANLGYNQYVYGQAAQTGRTQAQIDAENSRAAASQAGQTSRTHYTQHQQNRRNRYNQQQQNKRAKNKKKKSGNSNNPFGGD